LIFKASQDIPTLVTVILAWLLVAPANFASADSTGQPPSIKTQPQPALVRESEPLTLTVETTGAEPLHYTWHHEREPIPDSNSDTLLIDPIAPSDAGLYWVAVSNNWGHVGSDGVLVSVGTYTEWPVNEGGNGHGYEWVRIGNRENDWQVMFNNVKAAGGYLVSYQSAEEEALVNELAPPGTLTRLLGLIQPPGSPEPDGGWQWMSGEPLTYSNWSTENGEPNDGNGFNPRGGEDMLGIYANTGQWNDIHGGLRSYIIEYPNDLVLYDDIEDTVVSGYDQVALRAGAASKRPLTYTWFHNGDPIPGVTGNELPVEHTLPDGGEFHFEVTDGEETVTSSTAEVRLGPLFQSSPTHQVVYQEEPASLSFDVAGSGPFTYQWYRNTDPLEGATNANLVIDRATGFYDATYSLEVNNNHASARSATANLIVLEPHHRLVSLDSFETSSHPGWSSPATTVPPAGVRRFLGEFGDESVSLTLTDLPPHNGLLIRADLVIRGFWQGTARPDLWTLAVDNTDAYVTTFSGHTMQTYPTQYPSSRNFQPGTAAIARNQMGYELVFSEDSMIEDAQYLIRGSAQHTNAEATLQFTADLGNPVEAGWSLANAAVIARTLNGVALSVEPNEDPGLFNLRLRGNTGFQVDLQTSPNLEDWTSWKTVESGDADEAIVNISHDEFSGDVFFRAVGQQ
jgi:hypothetical protein